MNSHKMTTNGKVMITVAIVSALLALGLFFVSFATAHHDNDPNLEIYGWAYNVSRESGGPSTVTLVYNYTLLESYITNESNLDLYRYNYSAPEPTWYRAYATLDVNKKTLTVQASNLPATFVLGERFN